MMSAMASTSALQEAIEWVRGELAREVGVSFSKDLVGLTTGGSRRFNAVAADRSVVATVMNSSGATSGGKKPVGKIRGAIAELYYLSLIDAPQRQLIVTNAEFHDYLLHELDGALAPGILVRHVALPPELAERVAGVTADASQEMTR